jgi:hypothetical protein
MNEKFVTVAHFADYVRADLARQLLEGQGITVVVTGQNVGNIYAGLAGIANVELKTPESQAEEAKEILESAKPPEGEADEEQELEEPPFDEEQEEEQE